MREVRGGTCACAWRDGRALQRAARGDAVKEESLADALGATYVLNGAVRVLARAHVGRSNMDVEDFVIRSRVTHE